MKKNSKFVYQNLMNILLLFIASLSFPDLNAQAPGRGMEEKQLPPWPASANSNRPDLDEKLKQLTFEIERLKEIQAAQNAEIISLERKPAPVGPAPVLLPQPKVAVKEDTSKNANACCSWCGNWLTKLKVEKPKVELHGIIRLDFNVLDHVPMPIAGGTFPNLIQPLPPQLTLNNQLERKHYETIIDARYSRFYIEAKHEVCGTKVYGKIEADFWTPDGSSVSVNSRVLRLRHAYFRADFANHWYLIAGQTWSLISAVDVGLLDWFIVPVCDIIGPAGMCYGREPQLTVGYVQKLGCDKGEVEYFAGVEQQSVYTTQAGFPNNQIALLPSEGEPFKYPLFAAGIAWKKWEPLQIDIRAGVSENRFALLGTDTITSKTSYFGKFGFQTKIGIPTFFGQYTYMYGMSRFAVVSFFDSVIDNNLNIRNVRAQGAYLGTFFPIACDIMFTGVVGSYWAKEIKGTAFSGSAYKWYNSGEISLSRKLWDTYAVAVQWKKWNVKTFNGERGYLNQYMATMWYFF